VAAKKIPQDIEQSLNKRETKNKKGLLCTLPNRSAKQKEDLTRGPGLSGLGLGNRWQSAQKPEPRCAALAADSPIYWDRFCR
jgi:hypothetical protein